jgi:serine/threonine-protein kinase
MRPVPNESKIPVGTVLAGKYRVTREIGRGGMAAVYEAEQLGLGKKVAIKVLAQELAHSNIVVERFFREARAAASVRSPYIVDVYDSGRLEDGRPFIAMEYLEGESLYDRMARVRLIDPQTTVRVITQCAKGLMKAHKAGIVHRDLKPENIFLVKNEEGEETAKILDFGLAKFYSPVENDAKTARLTREGAVFGTPAYMSPEQVKGQGNVDHRADLWALGCMAFECLIGRPVWNTDQGVALTFAAIATGPIPVPSQIRPDLPAAFDAWFEKALKRDPAERFQSAKELAEALANAFRGASSKVSLINVQELEEIEAELVDVAPISDRFGEGSVPLALQPSAERGPGSDAGPTAGVSGAHRPPGTGAETPPPTTGAHRSPSEVATAAAPRPSALRWFVSTAAFGGGLALAAWVYTTMLHPQLFVPLVQSSATAPVSTTSSAPPTSPAPKWATSLAEGQRLFATGDLAGAHKKFKEAQEAGANAAVVRSFIEQTKAGAAGKGPCKMVAYAHPRLAPSTNVDRPAVVSGLRGPIVVWSDDQEKTGQPHAYSVLLDEWGTPTSAPRDLTMEATEVKRPTLLAAGDRTVLLYWDRGGREAGVRVRWLDAEGHIAGASTLVGASRPGQFWPSMDRAPEGYVVVWQDDRDKEGDDLFFRRLDRELEPQGPEVRLTDYAGPLGKGPNVRVPVVTVASNALFVAYKLERGPQHLIQRLRIPLDDPALQRGLEDPKPGAVKQDRTLGDVKLVNEDKLPGDAPALACGTEGCFLAWHNEQGGAVVALLDAAQGKVIWRKKLASVARPALATAPDGQVAIAFYEKGQVEMAMLSRDGLGPLSAFGRVTGDQPRPSIAPGKRAGEWLVAWQDTESFHSEVHVARLTCGK